MTAAWPLFDLSVTTPRLSLRLPSDRELMMLAQQGATGLLSKRQAGFMSGWALLASPEFERSFLRYHWRLRRSWNPSNWSLALGIYPAGEDDAVGGIDASASEFARRRSVSTGWWLLPGWRGRGLGKEALIGMVQFVFDGLHAVQARQIVHPENEVSLAISQALGYQPDGTERTIAGDGQPIDAVRLILHRDQWEPHRRPDISVDGLEACSDLFGL